MMSSNLSNNKHKAERYIVFKTFFYVEKRLKQFFLK